MNKNRIRLFVAGTLISLSLLLAACGGTPTPTPTPPVPEGPPTITAMPTRNIQPLPPVQITPTAASVMPIPAGTVGTGDLPAAGPTDQLAPDAQPTGNPLCK